MEWPLRHGTQTAEKLGGGGLSHRRAGLPAPRELGELAQLRAREQHDLRARFLAPWEQSEPAQLRASAGIFSIANSAAIHYMY